MDARRILVENLYKAAEIIILNENVEGMMKSYGNSKTVTATMPSVKPSG